MGKHIYENGHINAIKPYYFMLNGQRYNSAHFNGNLVFGLVVQPPTITTSAVNVTSTLIEITGGNNEEIWWAVDTPTNFQLFTGNSITISTRPKVIYAYAKVGNTVSTIVHTAAVATPTLTVDYASIHGQVVWFNNATNTPMCWSEDNWSTYNIVNNNGYAPIEHTMTVKCQSMNNGLWSDEVSQFCLWDVPEPVISFEDDTATIDDNYPGSTAIDIYYRIGATGSYTLYTEPIEIEGAKTVYAYSVEANRPTNASNVVSLYCNPYYTPFFVKNITNANETLSIVKENSAAPTLTIECSTDKQNWTTLGTTSTTAITRTITPGEKLFIRCSTNTWSSGGSANYIRGVSKVSGNIMSLLYGSNFVGTETSFPNMSVGTQFYRLFYNNTNLKSAGYLLLPATSTDNSCYMGMFRDCTNLESGPAELPATTLSPYCYNEMFYNCRKLAITPTVLPATTAAYYCYQLMFYSCYKITSAPALPATTLAEGCYDSMFYLCTALATAPTLAATTLATDCYNGMFRSCKLTTAPDLPAAALVSGCYRYMFNNCNYLTSVKCLATSGINNDNLYGWLDGGVGSSGTFYKKAGVTWPTGTNGIPSGWTVVEV